MQHVCLMIHTIFARNGRPVKIITKVFKSKALAIASVKQELIHKDDVRPNPNNDNDNVEFFDVDDPNYILTPKETYFFEDKEVIMYA